MAVKPNKQEWNEHARAWVTPSSSEPTIAAQLMRPLSRLLRTLPNIPISLMERCSAVADGNDRVPISVAGFFIGSAMQITGDPDLGLRLAMFAQPSDFEVIEWVASSAPTWNDACETVCRYARVMNETAVYRVELCDDKAHVILGSNMPTHRVLSDFKLAAFHLGIQRWFPIIWPELAVWMKHEQPEDMSAYRAIYPHYKLVVRAPFDGFVYDAWRLTTPLPTADSTRHREMRAHMERMLNNGEPGDSLVERASQDILSTMRHADVAAERTAARLGMARRTLVRRLKHHGTSFSELLKEVRYRTAVHYLQNTDHSVEDIAFLLGYSECAAFVRAFKRWSGSAPFAYRRLHA